MTDDVWRLMERCWAHDRLKRPTADAVCDNFRSILDHRKSSRSVPPSELSRPTTPVAGKRSTVIPVKVDKNEPVPNILPRKVPPADTVRATPEPVISPAMLGAKEVRLHEISQDDIVIA